jgi:hypothetical protein
MRVEGQKTTYVIAIRYTEFTAADPPERPAAAPVRNLLKSLTQFRRRDVRLAQPGGTDDFCHFHCAP